MMKASAHTMEGGRRLRLCHGPIDLIVDADLSADRRDAAYGALFRRFSVILDELCAELPLLRSSDPRQWRRIGGPVARRMVRAVLPHARAGHFITPMAAVAGAVADEMRDRLLCSYEGQRIMVNNGGDIALHLAGEACCTIGMVPGLEHRLAGRIVLRAADGIGGIATSGWRGRSHSLGIADAVTVLAASAAAADAAATLIANAVDLPGHPAIRRVPACELSPDSDLGARPVTTGVGELSPADISQALARGRVLAIRMQEQGLIVAAALLLAGEVRIAGGRHWQARVMADGGDSLPEHEPGYEGEYERGRAHG